MRGLEYLLFKDRRRELWLVKRGEEMGKRRLCGHPIATFLYLKGSSSGDRT